MKKIKKSEKTKKILGKPLRKAKKVKKISADRLKYFLDRIAAI